MTLGDALARAINQPGTMIQPPGRSLLRFWFAASGELCGSPEAVCGCKFAFLRNFTLIHPDGWYIVEEVAGPTFDDVCAAAKKRGVTVYEEILESAYIQLEKAGTYIAFGPTFPQAYARAIKALESGVFDD